MTGLLRAVRDFDLPPRWDGHAVAWEPWEPEQVIICPPPKPRPCPACGLIRPRATAVGRCATRPETTHREIENRAYAPHRHLTQLGHLEPVSYVRFHASRCTDCGHDQVYDSQTEQLWDLDWRDYGINGSTA